MTDGEIEEGGQAPEGEAVTTVDVPTPEPANDNSSDENAPGLTEPERKSRKERRIDRMAEARNEARESRRLLEQERAERTRLAEQVAEMRGRQDAFIAHQQRSQDGDPFDKAIADLEAKANRHIKAAGEAKDLQTGESELAAYHKAIREAAKLESRRDMQQEMARFRQTMPDPQMEGTKMMLATEFPWLVHNDKARDWTDGAISQLVAEGHPMGVATFRQAAAMAAHKFGLGGQQVEKPSGQRRSAYAGVSGGDGADGGGPDRLQFTGDTDSQLRRLAHQARPDLDKDQAYREWIKKHGASLARK